MSYQRGRQRQRDTGLIREERDWMKRASCGRERGGGGDVVLSGCSRGDFTAC